jgi:hypothetical protein
MKMRVASILILAPAVILLALPAAADQWDRDGHGGDWHGDVRHIEHRDFDHRRAGHWRHGWHEGRIGWWWVGDGFWNAYPSFAYPYPDPYGPPVAVQQAPPTVVIQQPAQSARPVQNWYFCPASRAYYPYVSTCAVGWQRVPVTPPQ